MEYKRVIKRNRNGDLETVCDNCERSSQRNDCRRDHCHIRIWNRLAELEDKIEQGTLKEMPCKVGDTVYKIEKDCHKCKHFKETGWEYDCWCDFDGEELKNMFKVDGDKDCLYTIKEIKFEFGTIPKFGKTVFLTREEAEKRLKELQE